MKILLTVHVPTTADTTRLVADLKSDAAAGHGITIVTSNRHDVDVDLKSVEVFNVFTPEGVD